METSYTNLDPADLLCAAAAGPGGAIVGQHLWSKGLDHANAYALARDPGGRSLATGVITGTMDFGGQSLMTTGNYDVFVAAFAP
jgi:hypothetical protein